MNRNLRFNSLEDAVAELNRLGKGKVTTMKLWTYFQILTHCADALEFSMSSYPRVMPGIIRKTIGKFFFNRMMKDGYMKAGAPNPSAPKTREEGDEKAALLRLQKALSAFEKFQGPFAIHPVFDELTKDQWAKLHSFHIANHLGFADIDENEESYRSKETAKKTVAPKAKAKLKAKPAPKAKKGSAIKAKKKKSVKKR